MSEKKPVIVYGAKAATGRLVCGSRLREYNIPFIAASRSNKEAQRRDEVANTSRHRDRRLQAVFKVPHRRGAALTELFKRRLGGAQHRGPFAKFGGEVVQACLLPSVITPLPPVSRTTTDHARAGVGREVRQCRAAVGDGASHRCTPPARSPRSNGTRAPASTPSSRVLGRQPDHRIDADHPGQRRDGQGLVTGAEQIRRASARCRPLQPRHPRPARAGAGAALGRHLASGVVQARSARRQRGGGGRRVQPRG